MKRTLNFTTALEDCERFADAADLERFIARFDGLELMVIEDERCADSSILKIEPRHVVGLHMSSYYAWLDLWRGNEEGLLHEFGTLEAAEAFYGGLDKQVIVDRFRKDLQDAHRYGAEYVVFHASETWSDESFSLSFHNSDECVIEALGELLTEVFAEEDGSLLLLMENLWHSGLTFTRPQIACDLLSVVDYANKGFMFDTGHAFHTNLELKTEAGGIRYVHGLLDALDTYGLVDEIRGIHLNQSLTGEYAKRTAANPPVLSFDPFERMVQNFTHAFAIDKHQPFTCPDVAGLVERIAPDYVTFEFITETREQLAKYIDTQWKALGYR